MRYAEQIRGLRLKLKLNQQQFAERLLVSQGTISRWEAGTQEPSKLILQRMKDLGGFQQEDLVKDLGPIFSPGEWSREVFIKGQVALNRLVENVEWPREQWQVMTVPEVSAWEHLDISAFFVSDLNDRVYSENSVVFVVPFKIDEVEPKPGDKIVFAEKHERSGRFEVILVEYQESFEKNHVVFRSSGLMMEFKSTLWEIVGASGGFREAGFVGLVVGGVMIEGLGRIAPRRRPESGMREDE